MSEAPSSTERIVRFGVFELDQRTGELRKAGLKLGLQDQPLHVLTMLLERPGELVTRDALKERLWPAQTFVDFEQGLNAAVKRLRSVLGDSAETPRFIETLPRRGYRFIGPVDGVGVAEPPPSRRSRRLLGVLTLIVALGVTLALALVGRRHFQLPQAQPRAMPLTSLAGLEMDPALSPDGNQVAFAWDGGREGDPPQLYVRMVDGGNLLKLTSEQGGAWSPTWSPDGRQIAFLRNAADGTHDVVVVPALGGPGRALGTGLGPRQLLPAEAPRPGRVDHGVSWSPDGKLLALVDKEPSGRSGHIALLSPADGTKRRLTVPPAGDDGDSEPRFSRDGQLVAFVRRPVAGAIADLYVVPVAGGEPTRLTFDHTNILGLDWSADGRDLVFSSTRTGSMGRWSLWRLGASGGTPRRIEIAGDSAMDPSIARHGDRMVYVKWQRDWDIWRVAGPVASGQARRASPFIVSTRWEFKPHYSPDGHKIGFISQRSGAHEIWVCNGDGSGTVQMTFLDSPRVYGPEWSPDGRQLAFTTTLPGNHEVHVMPSAGGFPRRLTHDPYDKALPSWSRDGHWIYFNTRRTGSDEVWKVPATGGDTVQVTRNGGTKASESADRKYLYFTKRALGKGPPGIWRVPMRGGPEEKVADQGEGDGWAIYGGGLCYADAHSRAHPRIDCLDFASGRTRALVELPRAPLPYGMSISPDRRWILYVHPSQDERDLMRVEGFQ